MYKLTGKQNNEVGDKGKQMMIIQVVLEKQKKFGEKKACVNNYFPPFDFRKAAGEPSADQTNMLGKPVEQNIFIPYV